jgi:hypothetical protein
MEDVQAPSAEGELVCHALLWEEADTVNGGATALVPHFLQTAELGRTVGSGTFGSVRFHFWAYTQLLACCGVYLAALPCSLCEPFKAHACFSNTWWPASRPVARALSLGL